MAKGKYGPITDDLDLIVGAEEPVVNEEARMIAPEPKVESGEFVESVEPSFNSLEGFVPVGAADQVIKEEVTSFITEVVAATNALEAHAINEAPEVIAEIKTEIKKETKMTNNFYVPKNIKTERALTKEIIKKVDSLNLDEVLKNELTGLGKSEISGLIDVHVSAETIKDTVITLIKTVKEKIQIDNKSIFDTFIEGIVGISAQLSYDANRAPLTVANFYKAATDKILAEVPNISAQNAAIKASDLVTAYVGKSVTELKGAATALPVKLLTLVVRRNAIPTINGKDDKIGVDLICNSFTSEYVKSVIADGDFVYIGLNLSKLFKYTQGHFAAKDLADIKLVSATILSNSASVNEVVYRIEKK